MKYKHYKPKTERAILIWFVVLSVLLATGLPTRTVTIIIPRPAMAQEQEKEPEGQNVPIEQENVLDEVPEPVAVRYTPPSGSPSQAQKDTTARLCSERFSGEVLTRCYYDLLAVAWVESRWNNEAIGDGGKSFGPFQIYTSVHKSVTWEQATDYEWALRWTINRMVHNEYPVYRSWALGSHNSYTPKQNKLYGDMVKAKSIHLEQLGL